MSSTNVKLISLYLVGHGIRGSVAAECGILGRVADPFTGAVERAARG
jgi:hypothetical protein